MHANASSCMDLGCPRRCEMRWEQLFADLQAQFEAEETAAEQAESGSRARAEVGALVLGDRLRGAVGLPLVLGCGGAGTVAGTLVDVGEDWLLVEDDGARQSLVASAAVRWVSGLGRRTAAPEAVGTVRGRLDLRRAPRGPGRGRRAGPILLHDSGFLTRAPGPGGGGHVGPAP